MPNERSGILPEEKQKWRVAFLENMLKVLNDKEVMERALIQVQGIKRVDDIQLDSTELNEALEALDKSDTSKYTADVNRPDNILLEAGFTAEDIKAMPNSFKLKADAAIFYAKSHNLLTQEDNDGNVVGFGPIDLGYGAKLLMDGSTLLMADKNHFINKELTQFCKPLLQVQFTRETILHSFEKNSFNLEERQILDQLLMGLVTIHHDISTKATIAESDFQTSNKNFQTLLSNAQVQLKKISGDKFEKDTDFSLIFSAIKPRSGLELLSNTFNSNTRNTQALGRMLLAIDCGTLTVNGKLPDSDYPIGEYLIHGGRVQFDVSTLSDVEQNEFFEFITANQAQQHDFASQTTRDQSKHYGINLAIGGNSIPNREGISEEGRGQLPQENGEWGYIHLQRAKNNNLVLVGIETTAPFKTNARPGKGESEELSAFLEPRINSEDLRKQQTTADKIPLNNSEVNNCATVVISSEQFTKMKKKSEKYENDPSSDAKSYAALVTKLPKVALLSQANQADPTEKKSNWWHIKPSRAAQFFGGLIAIAGLILCAVPIPGLAQAMGGSLVVIGVGLATATVGTGLFAAGTYNSPKTTNFSNENVNKMPVTKKVEETEEERQTLNSSPLALVAGLKVRPISSKTLSATVTENLAAHKEEATSTASKKNKHENNPSPSATSSHRFF